MNALIPMLAGTPRPAVSARELYRFLELRAGDFARWAESNISGNPFALENDDWMRLRIDAETPTGGRIQREDFALTLPLAKKLAMMSKSARAEQVRDYFLECERRALAATPAPPALDFSDPLTAARLFIEAETAKRAAEHQLALQAPAVAFARKVELSPVDVSISAFAKSIGWGPIKLHEKLRAMGFTYQQNGHVLPKQAYLKQGLFNVKETLVGLRVFPVTVVTGKGQVRLAEALGMPCQPSLPMAGC